MKTWHVGRLLDHVHLNVSDLDRSHQFYAAVLQALGLPAPQRGDNSISVDELYLSLPAPGRPTSSIHIAFQAGSQEAVQRFYAAALASGGRDNGAPGERDYHPGYYAAFAFDPDGNNIEAVFHGPSERSAVSVEITPEGPMKRPTFPPKPPAPSILPILGPAIERARRLEPNEPPRSHFEVVEDIGRSVVLPPGLLHEMRDRARRRDGGAE